MIGSFEVERALAENYLRSDGPGGGGPIRFIDASLKELRAAFGTTDDELAWNTLKSSFSGYELKHALETGRPTSRAYDGPGPGWFKLLIFTCAVQALPRERFSSNNFRERVAEAKGIRLSNIPGLAYLWEDLCRWLEGQSRNGAPYRTLVLADPGTMSQIGYTVNGTFPTWRDTDRMTKLWGDGERLLALGPQAVVRDVRRALKSQEWSDGFRAAFGDFEDRMARRLTLIEDHPFWVQFRKLRPRRQQAELIDVQIHLHTDIDGQSSVSITPISAALAKCFDIQECPGGMAIELGLEQFLTALSCDEASALPRWLTTDARSGLIALDQWLLGWCLVHRPEGAFCRLLVRVEHLTALALDGQMVGDWFLTHTLPLVLGQQILERIRGAPTQIGLGSVRVLGGIRLSSGYLGLPEVLPSIRAAQGCEIAIERLDGSAGQVASGPNTNDVYELRSNARLRGRWMVRVSENDEFVAALSLQFHDEADEWATSEFPPVPDDPGASELDLRFPIIPAEIGRAESCEGHEHPALSDLLEAIYAQGRTGWPEGKLVELVRRFFPERSVSAWEIIRMIEESGWLDARTVAGWQARKWYLRAPRLIVSSDGRRVTLDGSVPARVQKRFKHLVEDRGGILTVSGSREGLSVSRLVADIENHTGLAADMGFEVSKSNPPAPGAGMLVLSGDLEGGEQLQVVSHFDWEKGRFDLGPSGDDGVVNVERVTHPRRSQHDRFRVEVPGSSVRYFPSRVSAILFAFKTTSRQLWQFLPNDNRLVRKFPPGYIPTEIARYLSLRSGENPELMPADGEWQYRYPCSAADLEIVKSWLGPNLFETSVSLPTSPDFRLLAFVLTRRRGRHLIPALPNR